MCSLLIVLSSGSAGCQEKDSLPSHLDIQRKHFYDALTTFFLNYGDEALQGALSIEQCLQISQQNSNDLAIAMSRTKEAGYKVDQVKSAQNPTLTMTDSLTGLGPIATMTLPGLGSFKMGNECNYALRLTAQYLVSSFGILEKSKKAAYLSYVRTMVDESRVNANLDLDVIKSYFTLFETKGFVAVARQAINARQEQFKIAKANYDEGVFPKLEVIRANVTLKQAEQEIISANKALELTKAKLRTVMGLQQTAALDVMNPHFEEHKLPELQDAIESSYKNRPEMIQMELAVKISETNIDLAYKGTTPTLVLAGSYAYQSESFGSVPSSWTTGLQLQVPIFDGGATWALVQQAKEVLKQTTSSKNQLQRDLALQVKNAHLTVTESLKKMETEEANLEQAKEAYDITMMRYKEGIGTNTELDNALVSYLQSHSTLISAYCSYQRAWADLIYAMGLPLKGVYDVKDSSPSPEGH